MRQRACVDATAHPSGGYAVELALEESAQATALLAQLLEDRLAFMVAVGVGVGVIAAAAADNAEVQSFHIKLLIFPLELI